MKNHIFRHTQKAVAAAQTSQHPDSKVGAALTGAGWDMSASNFWPAPIKDAIGTMDKIGNASGTIHAETACLLHTKHAAQGATMFSTDPSCPNCAKNMAEAGIRHLYIDHKGFEKYFHQKRMEDFEKLTLPICAAAGIGVSKVFRKEQRLEEILPSVGPPPVMHDTALAPIPHFASCTTGTGSDIKVFAAPFRIASAYDPRGSKYDFTMQPLNRLLMTLARDGLTIEPDSITVSRVPTSRELVNFIGAGYTRLTILDKNDARDDAAFAALTLLQKKEILYVE